jgi:hypothetical protein
MERAIAVLTLLALAGCMGVENPRALDEPVIVHHAQFRDGKLPAGSTGPKITATSIGTGSFRPGGIHVPLSGRATGEAYSVGVSLLGQGSGHWIVPVGPEDLLTPGELTWDLSFDVGVELEPGAYELGVVAIDGKGRAGPESRIEVCALSDLPDNRNVCKPDNEPPAAIAALRWNSDVDLDLVVIAPDGTRYNRSNFSQLEGDEVIARLDADGSSGCHKDGRRIENFVWLKKPQKGTWFLYANLFDACESRAVSFELTTYRKQTNGDGTFALREEKSVGAELLRAQTKSDATVPLYLTKIEFP